MLRGIKLLALVQIFAFSTADPSFCSKFRISIYINDNPNNDGNIFYMYNATLTIAPYKDTFYNKINTQTSISDISTPIQIESNYSISDFTFGPIGLDRTDLASNSYAVNSTGSYSSVGVNTLVNVVKIALPAFYRGQSIKRVSGDFYVYDAFENGVTLVSNLTSRDPNSLDYIQINRYAHAHTSCLATSPGLNPQFSSSLKTCKQFTSTVTDQDSNQVTSLTAQITPNNKNDGLYFGVNVDFTQNGRIADNANVFYLGCENGPSDQSKTCQNTIGPVPKVSPLFWFLDYGYYYIPYSPGNGYMTAGAIPLVLSNNGQTTQFYFYDQLVSQQNSNYVTNASCKEIYEKIIN
uniref:Uncharacterized protein n=1 Tax=Acrobeloides nanus TaxID=290746 RepID=A0A914E8Y4_9BILA